jgi:hypothetical protein
MLAGSNFSVRQPLFCLIEQQFHMLAGKSFLCFFIIILNFDAK